jgi:hypothetical protein
MGGAIEHWLGFQSKIGRAFMMNEDAIKYPLSDYLVNEGGIDIKAVDLEFPHPNFSNRLMDVVILDISSKQLTNAFELKVAKSTTRNLSERKRIFNDIARLHLANATATGKCYFIITGKATHFRRDFQNLNLNGKAFYKKWLSFTKGQSITFNVATETDADYTGIYNNFSTKYSVAQPNQIKTSCEFITAFKSQFVPYIAGIWSVS